MYHSKLQLHYYFFLFSYLLNNRFVEWDFFLLAVNFWYNEQQLGGGWFEFLSLPELPKVYLDKEDALKVEIEFKAVSATKYSPII